jgi:hypothetical protein
MKYSRRIAALLFCSVCVHLAGAAPSAWCQTPEAKKQPTLASSVSDIWRYLEVSFVDAADAMPEERYSFAPTNGEFKGVRTFAEQVRHVACANFAFFNEFEGKTPPPDCEKGAPASVRTKTELMRYLRDSFAYADRVMATLDAKNALDPVSGRYATPSTKLGISVTAVWHAADHYGQMVEYLRMNGIIPPASRPASPPSGGL